MCLPLCLPPGALGQVGGRSATDPQALAADGVILGTTAPSQPPATEPPLVTASLQQCLTATSQGERSATFAAEMNAVPGSVRMLIRVDVQEESPGETAFRTITAPGLGVWRGSDAGVKTYRYLKQITNLSAPASYRADVRFRWVGARGHLIKVTERHTAHCQQPAPPASAAESEHLLPGLGGGGSARRVIVFARSLEWINHEDGDSPELHRVPRALHVRQRVRDAGDPRRAAR
jgi:hypothetical protein